MSSVSRGRPWTSTGKGDGATSRRRDSPKDAKRPGLSILPTHRIVEVLAPLMGGVPSLRYTPSEKEATAAFGRGDVAVALVLPATRLEDVKAAADAGQIMPPKSTYFAPKVPTEVVLRPLGGEG